MAWINLLDIIYPVGSVYISVNNTSPASIVGGTWTALYNTSVLRNYIPTDVVDGQAPLGEYAGSNFIYISNLPAHNHAASGTVQGYIQKYDADGEWLYGSTSSGHFRYSGVQNAPVSVTVSAVGGGERFLGVHTSVRMWKRTA